VAVVLGHSEQFGGACPLQFGGGFPGLFVHFGGEVAVEVFLHFGFIGVDFLEGFLDFDGVGGGLFGFVGVVLGGREGVLGDFDLLDFAVGVCYFPGLYLVGFVLFFLLDLPAEFVYVCF
jgi:hypothetical protein